MSLFNIGPDGLLIVEAIFMSALIAVLAWRRVELKSAAGVTAVVALVLVLLQAWYDAGHSNQVASATIVGKLIVAMFTIVPTALLLGASRLRWLSRHAWVLLLVGPVVFVGCFVGICTACAKAGLLGS